MQKWRARLSELGEVALFDYDYMRVGRKRPDPLPQLIAAHRAALAAARADSEKPVVLIGKSMGGRIGCHLALEEDVRGLVCFGYPLCGGGDPSRLRDKVLRSITTPILFIQGTRDALCPLELLEPIRAEMQARAELHVADGGDHSLLVGQRMLQRRQQTQEDVDREITNVIARFIMSLTDAGATEL